MNIRDIVNRDIVNLENCEQEPIHIPGSIQPHGCLLAIDAQTHIIRFASGNTEAFTGIAYTRLLGQSLEAAFGPDCDRHIREYISQMPGAPTLHVHINGHALFVTIHESGPYYILEAEPETAPAARVPDVFSQTRQFLSYMEHSLSLQELCQMVADRTRQLIGYDRVMIYRFDQEYNGEIFAESRRDDLEPFLGLHYPHTDIPVQARELYMRNMMRMITDTGFEPVPVYTPDTGSAETLDLSLSFLRSSSPIHMQYLQNMGVGATLTISIIHKHRLWGLIACHHYSPRNLSPDLRTSAQLQGHFIASQIDVRQASEEYDIARRTTLAVEGARNLLKSSQSFNALVRSPDILNICNASGVCILFQDTFYCAGQVPDSAAVRQLVQQFWITHGHDSLHTTQLAVLMPEAALLSHDAAGLIYHPLSSMHDDCIIWFRHETEQEVHWGGDPNKAIIRDENGLHPRKSFALWKEIVRGKSKPWLQPELQAAAGFAYVLQKHMALLQISASEAQLRQMTQELKTNNEELENLNWISTHDLQEPLRKIQLMASRVLLQEEVQAHEKTRDLIMRISNAAGRMQVLLRNILNYSKVRHSSGDMKPVALEEVINGVVELFQEQISDSGAQVVYAGLPQISGLKFLLSQLFTNLIGNSLKFTDPARPQLIRIEAMPEAQIEGQPYHHIRLSDTGIGFDEQYADSIFRIFSRLNNRQQYEGSGVGLALCRKIMDVHQGHISASGALGTGAAFDLFFPQDGVVGS